ncbi:MAG: hypothetical protein K6T83_00610 [Alicyclobacillus sp.]|nr:hypothetical protein [Alicyclobacillus sp.]
MTESQKLVLDIFIYLLAALLDSFGVALMIQTNFGATPFGFLTSNTALVLPVSVGACSFTYEVLYIIVAGKLSGRRIRWELLTYSAVFAILIDLELILLPNLQASTWICKGGFTLVSIVLIDLAKGLFLISRFPRLSTVELLYQISQKFSIKLRVASNILNAVNVIVGIIFSLIAKQPFHNLGIGTLMAVVLFGIVFQRTSRWIQKLYQRLLNNHV